MKNAAPRPGHGIIGQNEYGLDQGPGHIAVCMTISYAATAFLAVGTDAIVFRICEAMA
jgi:hypothetical protein